MPVAETELQYRTPFELLVAVILSAQCTDKRINMVTPALFNAYPTAEAMSKASADDIFQYIKSVTFPNNKARSLVGMANTLVDNYGGQVPDTIEELTKIPGVGRKTANVIGNGRRHACVPRIQPHRPHRRFSQPAFDRKDPRKEHTRGVGGQGSPLANTAWPVRLHRPKAQVPRVRIAAFLQIL